MYLVLWLGDIYPVYILASSDGVRYPVLLDTAIAFSYTIVQHWL